MKNAEAVPKSSKSKPPELLRDSEESAAQIARELGVPQTNLSRWKREMEDDQDGAFPGKGNSRDEELAQLRRENAKKERDILKKQSASIRADAPAVKIYQFVQAHASEHSVARMREGARGQPQRLLRLTEAPRKRARKERPTPSDNDKSHPPRKPPNLRQSACSRGAAR